MTIEAEGAVSIYDNAGRLIKVVETFNYFYVDRDYHRHKTGQQRGKNA